MKKFIFIIATIAILLSIALYHYRNVLTGTKVVEWEYEISNSLNNKKDTISFFFDEKSYVGFKNIKYLYSPNFDEIINESDELDEFYAHLKNVVATNFHKTLLNKFDMMKETTKKVYFDNQYVEVYSDDEVKAIDWAYNEQSNEFDVTLQTINDFIETYKYSNKSNYKYVKIEKNNLSLELKLTNFKYHEG